ncbi:MAG: sterol desaturase family protein [Myxococcota bacterium]|nr:sterol desaturase family protein [Myxococcota bacterium]MEC9390330.1 sterol desaturase family protein [Myxococcota bacterium]
MLSARPESPRMFESDFVDFFSRTPWWSIPLIWGPIVVGLFAYGVAVQEVSLVAAATQAVLGVIFWTFSEYWLHRTVFHWEPDHAFGRRFHFILHGCHHTWIDDPYRLVMPPAAGMIIASLFWAAFTGVATVLEPMGIADTWRWAFFGGFLGGYINYDLTHYATHHVKLTNNRLKRIRRHHMTHHFKEPDRKFGFTTFFWDRLFGTL